MHCRLTLTTWGLGAVPVIGLPISKVPSTISESISTTDDAAVPNQHLWPLWMVWPSSAPWLQTIWPLDSSTAWRGLTAQETKTAITQRTIPSPHCMLKCRVENAICESALKVLNNCLEEKNSPSTTCKEIALGISFFCYSSNVLT